MPKNNKSAQNVNKKLSALEVIQINAALKTITNRTKRHIPLRNTFYNKLENCGLTYAKFKKLLNILAEQGHVKFLHLPGRVFFRLTEQGLDWLLEDDK